MNYFRRITLLLLVIASTSLFAGPVSKEAALQKAQQFMPSKKFSEAKPMARSKTSKGQDAYYIFNADNGGFVIVSGDDRTVPILGYSKTSTLDASNMSPNLQWWLSEYARQMDALGTSLTVVESTKTRSTTTAIAPLIKTNWGQEGPYNNMCPDGSGNDYYEVGYNPSNRCVTGCEATAMAQVMNYWQWPESSPALDAYTADFEVKALPSTTFKWSKMKEDYAQDETGEAADAVAELMRYCGQADKMNYSTNGSTGMGIPWESLVEIFNYSRNITELRRDFYSTEEWENIILEELSEGRPVLYGGYSTNVGHQFIVDGYDSNGLFHINWGWNGSANDYFILSVADPGHPGVEGASARDGYMYFQSAIVRLQPNREDNLEPYAVISNNGQTVTFYYDSQRKVRGGIDIVNDKVDISPYASVTKVVIDESFANYNPLSTAYWFYNCDKLEEIDGIANIKTVWVNNMNSMFSGCSSLKGIELKGFKTGTVRNMCDMFRGCSSLTSLNVSAFDTGNVQNMDAMFRNCSSLTSLDLSGFNTEKVTNMSQMFSGCSSLSSLNVSSFNTAKVTSMLSMFSGCSCLTSLDVSHFKTDYVTEMGYMFANCTGLTSLDVSSFNTSKVAYMSGMFSGCTSLTSLDVSHFNTANLKNMGLMFENCSSLTTLDLCGLMTDNVTSLNATFSGCSSLTTLDLSSFDTGNVSNMAMTFWGCSSLQTIYVSESKWSTASVTSSNMMFSGCTSLKGGNGTTYDSSHTDVGYAHIDMEGNAGYLTAKDDSGEPELAKSEPYAVLSEDNTVLTFFYDEKKESRGGLDVGPFTLFDINRESGWFSHRATIESVVFDMSFADCNSITSTAYWFYGCSKMTKITDISNLKTDNIFSMSNMFNGCSSLKMLDLTSFKTENVTDMESMFLFCKSLQTIYVSEEYWNVSNVSNSQNMFSGCISLVGSEGTVFDASHIDGEYARIDKEDAPGYLTAKNSGTDPSDGYEPYVVYNDGTLTFYFDDQRNSRDGVTYDLNKEENLPGWNENKENITKAVFDDSFTSAKPVVTSCWFSGCSSLQSIDGLANLNTSRVTSMNSMFQECSSLTDLDLSHFDTRKVKTMGQMFYGCTNLTSLDLSNFDTSNVTYMGFMFNMCSNLTSLNLSSFDTKNVTGMRMMFRSCRNLTSLDVSNFDVQNATDLSEMFAYCEGLTSLDVSKFNTAKAETMGYMFRYCDKLTSLNLSSFSTQSAKDHEYGSWTNYGVDGMLFGCSSLSEIKFGSDFATDENLSCTGVFAGCNSLGKVIYSGDIPASIHPTFFNGVGSEKVYAALNVPEEYLDNYAAKFEGDSFFGGYFTLFGSDSSELNDGDLFTAKTIEGVEMTFMVISAKDKTCQVGDGKNACIDTSISGSLTIPTEVNGLKVNSIASWALYRCLNLNDVVISEGVERLMSNGIEQCNGVTSFVLPSSVTSLDQAFGGISSNLKSIKVADGNPVYDSRDNCNAIIETATNTLRCGCSATVIPLSVTAIGDWSMSSKNLTSISIPNSVTYIGEGALCYNYFKSVVIPASVSSIGGSAFSTSYNLEDVTILSSKCKISGSAFAGCSELKKVVSYIETPEAVRGTIFYNSYDSSTKEYLLNDDVVLYVPKGTKEVYEQTDGWKNFTHIVEGIPATGDVTGEGEVNSEDVIAIVKMITSGEYSVDADVNGDGVVNVADIIEIINSILAGQTTE